jgi:CRISPR-associated endoribonuclease Cas6
MRIKVTFGCTEDIILPVDYNYYIQSFIYKNISEDMAEFLHSNGYHAKGRSFKLFTFSKLLGKLKYDKDNKRFYFKPPVSLQIASPVDDFIISFANKILVNNELYIAKNKVEVQNINFEKDKAEGEIFVKTLSPVVVYSTLFDPTGKKYTVYFVPHEPKFEPLIVENLKKKITAFGRDASDCVMEIKPVGTFKQKIVTYKGFTIKGSEGKFKLKGSENMLNMALNAGMGAKNSQGFGCVIKI